MKSEKSKYKYVYPQIKKGQATRYQGYFRDIKERRNRCKSFKTEREAALWVDKTLLQIGRQPVNILKKK